MIYTREITDDEIKILEHFIPNVQVWIDTAISEKINSCKKRILRNQIGEALEKNAAISTKAEEVLAAFFSKNDYMNRSAREQAAGVIRRDNGQPIKTSI